MRLVVHDLAFLLGPFNCLELTTANCVSDADDESFTKEVASISDKLEPYLHHDLVDSLWISSDFKAAFFVDVGKPTEHVCAWNPHFVEH